MRSGNYSTIGARIKVTFKENGITRSVYRAENSGGSFGCSPLRREIGIGKATLIDEIAITWPGSNNVQRFANIKPYQFVKIKQGSDRIETVHLKVLDFKSLHKNMVACPPLQASVK